MMSERTFRASLCACLLLGLASGAFAQSITNAGKDFIIGFLPNYGSSPTIELHLTAAENTQVTVNYPVNSPTFETTVDVTAGDITIVSVPSAAAAGWTQNAVTNNAVRVFSPTEDNFVCYMINLVTATSDAGLALPLNALNTEYIVTTYSTSDAEFVVVAAYDDTDVTFTAPGGAETTFSLNRGEGYLRRPGTDATGTIVSASRPVSVSNGNECAGFGDGACDHVFEVAVPVAAWGDSIPVANIPENSGGTRYKIITSTDNTAVTKDGEALGTINRGEFIYTDKFTGNHIIAGNNPIFVTQFMDNRGEFGGDPTGDPAIGNMVPGAQFMNSYTFSTVGGGQFTEHYVTIIAATEDVGTLTLDDVAVDSGEFSAITGSDFSVASIVITDGVHQTASPNGHGITVMGFNSNDSYLFTGGASFAFINPTGDPWAPDCDCSLQTGPPKVFNCTATETHPDEGDDSETGVFSVELLDGSDNIELTVDSFTPGDSEVTYSIQRTDEETNGTGTVRVTDGAGNNCDYEITFESAPNTAPVADAGGPYIVECAGDSVTVTLDGTGSSDADEGDSIAAYAWTCDADAVSFDHADIAEPTATVTGGTGAYTVQLTVTDTNDATNQITSVVSVIDTTAPTITTQPEDLDLDCSADDATEELTAWLMSAGGAEATDVCDGDLTWTYDWEYDDQDTLDCDDVGETTVTFIATDIEGNEATATATLTVENLSPDEGEVDLEISVERVVEEGHEEDEILVSQTIEYEVTVRNVGTAGASQVTVSVPLPEGTELVSASLVPQSGRTTTETLTFDIGDLAAGATYVIQLVLRVLTEGDFSIEATADSAESDKVSANNTSQATDTVETAEDIIVTTVLHQYGLCGAIGFAPLGLMLVSLAALRKPWRDRRLL